MPRRLLIALIFNLCAIWLAFQACSRDVYPGRYQIPMTESIRSTTVNRGQVYWEVGDTAAWVETLRNADTIMMAHDRMNLRIGREEYVLRLTKSGWRSSFPHKGWVRRFDTLGPEANVVRLLNNNRVTAEINAADVVLDGDSLRIGLIHITGRAFTWQTFDLNEPDYLMLTTYGNEIVPIAMDQDNIGPISRQTVFRVGRRTYVLRSVSEDYQEIEIEQLEDARAIRYAAELDIYYKQVAVEDMEGNPTTIKRTPGRDLALYFWGLGPTGGEDLIKLDSLYGALSPEVQAGIEIVLINHLNSPESIREFMAKHNIRFPAYKTTPKTCLRLNCHPYVPYFVGVNEKGRITTYYGWREWLEERLGAGPQVQGK
ncbi:MAG: peroxiredoxin family protein [Lewinella sp.]